LVELRDWRLLVILALYVALAVAVIYAIPAVMWARPPIDIAVEPRYAPLNGRVRVEVRFLERPAWAVLELLHGPSLRVVKSVELPPEGADLEFNLSEREYSVGLYVVRVRAEIEGKEVSWEEPFSVYYGGNLTVRVEAPQTVEALPPEEEGNWTATAEIRVYVENEVGEPVEGATVWLRSQLEEAGAASFDPDPAETGPDGWATVRWSANVTENVTEVVKILVGAPGHPLGRGEISIRVEVKSP